MVKNTQMLELVAEDKVANLLTGENVPERLEASGVFFLDGFFYLIFDNVRQIAKIKKDLNNIQDNCLVSVKEEQLKDAFEDITYNYQKQKFYLLIEASEQKKGEHPILVKIGVIIREYYSRIMTVFKYLLVPYQKTHLLNCSLKNQLFFVARKLCFF